MKSDFQIVDRGSNARPEIVPYVPSKANTVLEVGFGQGAFCKLLRTTLKTPELWGVEINHSGAMHAAEYIDKIVIGDFESQALALPKQHFDCVVFNDVLEHFVDPWSVLNYTKTLLKPHGKIVASIPNVRFWGNLHHLLFDQDWQYEAWGVRDRTHLRFFTRKSIKRMMNDCGLIVDTIQGINSYDFTKKYRLLKNLFPEHLRDTEFLQFVVVLGVAPEKTN